jgi:hypothetical protein
MAVMLLTGCAVQPPTRVVYVQAPPPPPAPEVYRIPAPLPVVSIYVEPPLYQPPPIRIAWAPPPMLVEIPPPLPYFGAVWTGGYWVWEGNWVWARGRWVAPPRPDYAWVNPYYEHRAGSVIFVNGFWAAPGVSFMAPSLNLNIAFGVVAAGIVAGPRPMGPEGVFIPAPPGSYAGLIVPAPIGTAPAVVTGAPPIIRTGMRVNVVNNNTVTTTNNVTNVTNVNIVAPASATASGQAVNTAIPAQPHLAAAMSPVVRAFAPEPASAKPIPALVPGRAAIVLPTAQMVHPDMLPAALHQHASVQGHQPQAAQGAVSPQSIPLPAPHTAVPAAAPTSQIPSAATSKPLEPAAITGKQEAKSTNADAPFKTDIAAGRDGNATTSAGVKRVASKPANSGEFRQPNTKDLASAPSKVKPAKPAPVTKLPTRPGDASQDKPVKRAEAKRPEVKKPMEAEKAAEKHSHE